MISKSKIKVLVVDDSALIRQTLIAIISSQENMEVIATASDPYVAVTKMKTEKPDVITLDIQMPRMDGITFLKKIMKQHPLPVVVISSITKKESEIALSAYKYGAIDVIEKPIVGSTLLIDEWKEKLVSAITAAARSHITKFLYRKNTFVKKADNLSKKIPQNKVCNSFIVIGSSAGGTEVIFEILSQLNANTPPILIVQHMPVQFTASYAQRLNDHSKLTVREAISGDQHMELKNNGFNFFVELNTREKVNRHRPSVDMLFKSAVKYSGNNILAIILSGMGNDGSEGMLELKKAGATTIAQSGDSCIVYGMPKEALKTGAADFSLPINAIISAINKFAKLR